MSAQTNDNRIIESDAKRLLGSLEKGSVKLILTDPPYGIAYHSGHYKGKNPHAPVAKDWNFQVGDLFRSAERCLAEDGAMYVFTRWDVYPLWSSALVPPLELRNSIVWMKNNWSAGDLGGNFGNQYELLLFITKSAHKLRGTRWPNIWQFPRIPSTELRVATEKPVALLERAILASTDKGDVVVDPYCGSGSTGQAAQRTGRRFLLGDIDASMVELASRRLGFKEAPIQEEQPEIPECPILKITPPAPHLWGIHPEDLAEILNIEKRRIGQMEITQP